MIFFGLAITIIFVILCLCKSFSVINCTEKYGHIILKGQLRYGTSVATLPNISGKYGYVINVSKGQLRLNHSLYNPDGGTYSLPPNDGTKRHIELKEKFQYKYIVTTGENYGGTRRIELVNTSIWENAEFSYSMYLIEGEIWILLN